MQLLRALFYKFPAHVVRCFSLRNILWQLLGIAATFLIVMSGFDWWWYSATRELFGFFFPPAILGFIVPIMIPLVLYMWGAGRHDAAAKRAGACAGQAVLIAYIISCAYKAVTNRAHPLVFGHAFIDTSRQFHFGFLQNNIFWGWPSSHTAVAFALAASLITLYPRDKVMRLVVALQAFYIGFGVSITIHWFSDAVMGAIVGIIAGAVVAKGFRQHV